MSVRSIAYIAAALALAGGAHAQTYPTKPVRFVTSEIGGSADAGARLVAQGLTTRLGQQVIVDNRGSGVIPGDIVARSRPDGYTLLFFGGTFWLQPLLRDDVPYDPVRDFAPVSQVIVSPSVLVVHPSLPVHTVKDLIALAKAKPGDLNCATGARGSTNYLAAELFKAMASVDIVGVGYKGTGPAVAGLISSQVQLMFATASAVMAHVKTGRLRAIAVGSSQHSAVAPGLPTVAESGLPGYESVSITAIFAPAKTPRPIIDRLNRETVAYLATPEAKERFLLTGGEAIASTPEALGAKVKAEIARMSKVLKKGPG